MIKVHISYINIDTLICEFIIQNHKSIPYHPKDNETVEAINKIMENGLTKLCCTNCEYLDERVPVVLWPYRITTKKLHKYTPFQLVYG
jgi:hypothetical protein